MSVVIRPATTEDFIAFRGEPPVWRTRAWTGELDGRILGMGGIAYPPGSPCPVIWAEFCEDAYRYRKTLHKAGVEFLKTVDHPRIVCVADKSIGASRRWAERLGFKPTGTFSDDGEIYLHDRHRHQDQHQPAA